MNKSVARGIALALLSATSFYAAADAHLIRVGFNPGPYKEQFEKGVAPYLLSKGYKIEYKDFSDGIQVNDAVARGDIEANIMQHPVYLKPGTYVRPHRHPHTFELLLPLRGRFVVLNFDDRGTVTHRAILGETCTVLEMAAGTWHAVLSLDTGGIIFEVKHGGYQPVAADDYAHWAPAEGEPGTTELMAWYAQAQVGDSTFAV